MNSTSNSRLAPELAIRALAVYLGITKDNNPIHGMDAIYNSVSKSATSGRGAYLLEIDKKSGSGQEAYKADAARLTFSNTSGSILNTARSIYKTALSQPETRHSDSLAYLGEDMNYTISKSGGNGRYTYNITFDRAIRRDKIDVQVQGATSSNYSVNGNVLTIVVNYSETQCSFQIQVIFRDGVAVSESLNSSLFLCSSSKDYSQSYVVQMEASAPGTITINNNGLCERCECPTYYEEDHVQMCCTDNEPSEIVEPFIKDLFCDYKPSNEILVNGFVSSCRDQYKIPSSLTGIPSNNTYCEVYCSERIKVNIPNASSSSVGMYFDLTPTSSDSKGPLFKGKRTCREIIHYDKWVEDYINLTKDAINKFNTYQEYLSYKKMYDSAASNILSHHGRGSERGTAYYSCTGQARKGCLKENGEEQGSVPLSTSQEVSCGYEYSGSASSRDYPIYYYPLASNSLNYLDGGSSLKHNVYRGFQVAIANPSTGNSDSATKVYGLYGVRWSDTDCNAPSYKAASGSVRCYEEKCTPKRGETTCQKKYVEEPVYNSHCGYSGVSRSLPYDIQPRFKELKDNAETNYENAKSSYNSAVQNLTDMEEYYRQCDQYYDDASLGAATLNQTATDKNRPYRMYSLSPNVTFHYFQAHVENVSQMITPKETVVDFAVKCEHKLKKIDTENDLNISSNETELGLETPHYNNKNENKYSYVKTFNVKDVDFVDVGRITGTVLDALDSNYVAYNHRYRHDAYYEDTCVSNDVSTGSYYVYPYGSISYEESKYYSTHDVSYYIEYSTLFANYETYWEFSSVGMGGRFDEKFVNHGTCSGNTNYDSPRLFCTLRVEPELTEISGCNQDAVIAFLNGFDYNWKDECCNGSDCKDRSTDQLTYAFKIVDSAKLFPDDGYASNDRSTRYGYNWLEDSNGVRVLREIQNRANYPTNTNDVYSKNNITYEFNLSSQDLALIKEYNSTHSYNDFEMECKKVTGSGGKILRIEECKSNFITNYYNGKILTDNDASVKLGHLALDSVRTSNAHFHFYRK